ncbi:MAG: trans-aconitate 2-methyltransferase [Pirellulales bacterium]
MLRRVHWDDIYRTKKATEVSWFEAEPEVSLTLLHRVAPQGGSIIDVGGGASLLVDRLVAAGNWDVTVLDVSAAALDLARRRVADTSGRVRWMQADITEVEQLGTYDVWHDRAVFHFLTRPEDREAYLTRLRGALPPGGHAVLGTFALDGPEQCSGLQVCRYDAASLAAMLGPGFLLREQRQHVHHTPSGGTQRFTFAVFRASD